MWSGLFLLLALQAALPSGAVLEGYERRGAVIARLDGASVESWRACASSCSYHQACQSWTFHQTYGEHPAQCRLHANAPTPTAHPGAVTGLSAGLARRIEDAAERAPDARERRALSSAAPM
ncbi:MAG: PAN domain-containing protein [Pseudomonadota bacterium]